MRIDKDHVLIKIKKSVVDKRGNIHMVTSSNKDQHYDNKAEVVSIPIRLSRNKRLMIPKTEPLKPNGMQGDQDFASWYGFDEHGYPLMTDDDQFRLMGSIKALYSEEQATFHNYADIAMEVEVGDMIYFNWTAFSKRSNFLTIENEYQIWKIDYPNIFCSIRKGKIIMIGSWTLVAPEWQDILKKTYYPLELTGTVPKLRPEKEWIQTKTEPTSEEMKGCVKYIGTPFKGKEREVNPGDHVYFMKGSKIRIEIEGKKYYVMRQHRIMAHIED